MKKMLNIIIIMMLMASITSLVIADEIEETQNEDDIEIDEETQEQAEIMNTPLGAEIRLLQLEKAITKNILKGEDVIAFLTEAGYNTTDLEVILIELQLVLDEVQDADTNSSNATQIFVDLKNDSIQLTKDFRDTLKEIVNNTIREQLRERIKEMVSEQVMNLSKKIQNKIKQLNRNQLHNVYELIGILNESFLEEYKNGNVTLTQVKIQLNKMMSEMTKEKRYELFSEIKQNKIKNQIKAKICVENATENFKERKENRLNNRINQSENMYNNSLGGLISQRIRNRLNEINNDNNNSDNGDASDDMGGNGNQGNGKNQQSGKGGKQ